MFEPLNHFHPVFCLGLPLDVCPLLDDATVIACPFRDPTLDAPVEAGTAEPTLYETPECDLAEPPTGRAMPEA